MLPNSGRSRLAVSLLWITVIVILASYSGTLISYLAVDIRRLPFTSLNQVIRSPLYEIWVDTESIYAEIFGVSIGMFCAIHLVPVLYICVTKNGPVTRCEIVLYLTAQHWGSVIIHVPALRAKPRASPQLLTELSYKYDYYSWSYINIYQHCYF